MGCLLPLAVLALAADSAETVATTAPLWKTTDDAIQPAARMRGPLPMIPGRIRLAPPLRRAYELRFDGAFAVLPSPDDMLLGWHGRRVEAFDPVSGKPRWSVPLEEPLAPHEVRGDDDAILLVTRFRLVCIDRKSGRVRWTYGDVPSAADSARLDPEVFTANALCRTTGGLAVVVDTQGALVALNVHDGTIAWKRQGGGRPSGPADASSGYLFYAVREEGRSSIVQWDVGAARRVRTWDEAGERQIAFLHAGADRVVIAAGRDWIGSYSADADRLRWSAEPAGLRVGLLRVTSEHVIAPLETGELVALRLADGGEAWRIPGLPAAHAAVVTGSALQVVGARRMVSIDHQSGRVTADLPFPSDCTGLQVFPTSPHAVLLASREESLRVAFVSSQDPNLAWYDLGAPVSSQVSVRDGALLVQDASGVIAYAHADTP